MTRSRSSHQQKGLKDRQRYFKTTLGRSPAPTIDDHLFDVDATDVEAPETTTETEYKPTRFSSPRPSALGQFLKENWLELVLFAVLGFLWTQVFTLNREVGELKSQLDDARHREERLENQLDRLNEKLEAPRQSDKK